MAVFAESLEARCEVENEDIVGAAPTDDAPTTSEWSTILLLTKDASYIKGFTAYKHSVCETILTLLVNTTTVIGKPIYQIPSEIRPQC